MDGFFAATALAKDLTLVTRNVKDFAAFGVPMFEPWNQATPNDRAHARRRPDPDQTRAANRSSAVARAKGCARRSALSAPMPNGSGGFEPSAMSRLPSPSGLADAQTRRALELDALSAILPMDRRDRLAGLLTDDDVENLKHLAREGIGENTLRALASDLAYLEAWALAATKTPLPWPAPEALPLKFIAHHLWDPAKREIDPTHGMPTKSRRRCRALACCASTNRMRPQPSSDGSRIGRPCTGGKVLMARSPPRRCAPRCALPFAPPRTSDPQEQARNHQKGP